MNFKEKLKPEYSFGLFWGSKQWASQLLSRPIPVESYIPRLTGCRLSFCCGCEHVLSTMAIDAQGDKVL
jgi:hypothetical protein